MKRHNYLCVVVLLVIQLLAFTKQCNAGASHWMSRKKKDDTDVASSQPLSLQTSTRPSTKAVRVRPHENDEQSLTFGKSLMQGSTLSDRFTSLSPDTRTRNNEFVDRLRSEEQEQARIVSKSKAAAIPSATTSLLWKAVGGSLLLLLSSQLLLGTSTNPFSAISADLYKASQTALCVSWLPWMWIRPSPLAGADLLSYVQLFAKVELLEYLWVNIFPSTVQTFRKLLVAELWNKFWTATFKQVNQLFPSAPAPKSTATSNGDSSEEKATAQYPAWLVQGHSFLTRLVHKGTKKVFQSTLQKHVQASIAVVVQASFNLVREQLLLGGNQADAAE